MQIEKPNPSRLIRPPVPGRRSPLAAGLGALLVAGSLAGCAGTALEDSAPPTSFECILDRTIRDYSTLDDRNLILNGPGNRAYHVVLSTPSLNLEREFTIGVIDRDGDNRICPFGRDRILVGGPLPEQIPIRSIEAIDEGEVEDLKVRFGVIEAAPEGAVTVTEIE